MNANDAKQKLLGSQWMIHLSAVVALVIGLVLWPQPAHADWRSLSGLLPEYVNRVDYTISPDSHTVAFIADKDTDDVGELYAVPITGTMPIKLNPPLVTNGDVQRFAFTPDGQSVIYLADQEVDNRIEMFSVPVSGGPALKLNPPLVVGGNVAQFKIDAKNGRIVYMADQETNEIFELWSISITGGGLFKLNGAFVSGGDTGIFEIDPLSNRVVYSADQETDGKYELYSVPILGGTPLKLNPPIVLTGGGDSGIYSAFEVNPIVPVVVFIAREAGATGGRLYMIPTAGGSPIQLSFNLLATQRMLSFRISPAGDRVVFNVGTNSGGTNAFKGNLYSQLIGGGGPANVTETADPLFGTDTYRILPNGSHVVYSFQNNVGTTARLESATMLGVRAPLYVPGASDAPLYNFDLSPDSQWVVYQDSSNGLPQSIHTIPPTGGSPTNFGASNYKVLTPDSARIAYTRIVSIENRSELFSAQIFGGDERNLSGMDGAGYIGDVKVSPDSKWIVFAVQIDNQYDLRVSDGAVAQPTPTPSATPSPTPTTSPTPMSSPTPIASPTPMSSPTPDIYHSLLPAVIK
jgi:Tol biopolymer transport system component